MDAVRLSRLTTALAVGVVGGVAGHVIAPFVPGAPRARAALFVALLVGTGAVRGWREAVVRGVTSGARIARLATLYAVGAVTVALAGYWIAHG